MNKSLQHALNWSVIIGLTLTGTGLMLAGYIPPLSPALSPEAVAQHYQQNTLGVRFGAVLMFVGVIFVAPFFAGLTLQVARLDPPGRPILGIFQGLAGAANVVGFALPPFFMSVTAYRPDRDPAVLQVLHDITWFIIVSFWAIPILPCLGVGIAILTSARDQQIFPRWIGLYNLWLVFVFSAGALAYFFYTGPFAWDGLMVFWVPLGVFGPWFFVMFWAIKRAIDQDDFSVQPAR